MSRIPEPPFKWATVETITTGPATGNPTKDDPSGWPDVAQGVVPGQPVAGELINRRENNTGDWLNYLSEFGIQNWNEPTSLGTTNPILSACWLASADSWIGVGDEEAVVSRTGRSWSTLGSPSGIHFTHVFAGAGKAVALTGSSPTLLDTDTIHATTGSGAWLSNEETDGDILVSGIYESNGGHHIVGGFESGGELVFLFTDNEADVGTTDLSRFTNGHEVPALGSTVGAVRSDAILDGAMYFADRGDGMVLALVSYRGASQATVYQYVSADGGETWIETRDVITPTEDTAAAGLKGVGYDTDRNLWVAMTGDGNLYIAPPTAEVWHAVASGVGGGAVDRFTVVDGFYMASLTPAGTNYIMWSRDGGSTWRKWGVDPSNTHHALAFGRERGQWLLTAGADVAHLSSSVGQTPAVPA